MNSISQILAVTALNLRSIPLRLGNSLVIVIGIAGVVAVLISVLAMAAGFMRTIEAGARPDRALILARGSQSEAASSLTRANFATVEASPGVRKDTTGKPIASAEVVLVAPVARKGSGADAYLTLRGVGEQHFHLRPELAITSGRMFKSGVHELIVGRAAQTQFDGLDIGGVLRLHDGDWTIVGVFAGGDNVRASEVMADAQTVMSAYRMDAFNSATVLLDDARSIGTLKNALDVDPSLSVDVLPEPEYLALQSRRINLLLRVVAYAIGGIMAVGALFGALNTMYSAVTARAREIATLRAIGFDATAIVVSILIESLLLSIAGAVAGIAVASIAFNGEAISTLGGSRWDSQVVYSLTITPELALLATILAGGIGLLGGLFPAIHAARASVVVSLRTA